jgi:pimeloyl-ACP methyl ester carboxylesterase
VRTSRSATRFCTATDGTRLAYALHGHGPPLVRVATWLTHLELDWDSPVWRHWLAGLGDHHTVVRYDERGCGLSGPLVDDPSVDTWTGDLEAVVDAVGLEPFALLGVSQGAAIAVEYAARHPDRVRALVLYGGYARGRRYRGQAAQEDALLAAIRAGWAEPDSAFRHVFSMLFLPHGTPAQMTWYDALLRTTTTAHTAARLFRARGGIDVTSAARRVAVPTLVLHARGDRVVPIEEGRLLAELIPGAGLLALDSDNHILLDDEPAWTEFLAAVEDFLGSRPQPGGPRLTRRELDVLELVAGGLGNDAIAQRLCLSTRTVERHLSNVYTKLSVTGKPARAAAAAAFASVRPAPGARR